MPAPANSKCYWHGRITWIHLFLGTGGGTVALANGLAAGTYTITVSDAANCVSSATTTVSEPNVLAATAAATNVSCGGCTDGTATAAASGGTTAYTYSWNSISAQTTATATGLGAGLYTCTITDANGCSTTTTTSVSSITGVVSAVFTDSYKVYPNPAKGFVTVELQRAQKTHVTLTLAILSDKN